MKDKSTKLLSVLCAIFLWFYVVANKEYTLERDVPVLYNNLPAKIALYQKPIETIKVRVKAKGTDFLFNQSKIGFFKVKMDDLPLGKSTKKISIKDYVFEEGGEIFSITSFAQNNIVKFEADAKLSKSVQVDNKVTFTAGEHHILVGNVKFKPNFLTIRGARYNVTKIFKASTEELNINNIISDTTFKVALAPFPWYVESDQKHIDVQVSAQPLAQRTFQNVPVHLINFPLNNKKYSLSPNKTDITITGGKQILDSLNRNEINIFVEYTRYKIQQVEELEPIVSTIEEIQSYSLSQKKFKLIEPPVEDSTSTENKDVK